MTGIEWCKRQTKKAKRLHFADLILTRLDLKFVSIDDAYNTIQLNFRPDPPESMLYADNRVMAIVQNGEVVHFLHPEEYYDKLLEEMIKDE